jgi:hypothetical protein
MSLCVTKRTTNLSAQQQPAIHGRRVLFPGVASGLMFTPAVRAVATAFLVSSRYGVFCRVKYKTRLGRKVHSWWREDIDEPRRALAHVLGGVNHSCRNDEDRRTFVVLMFVIAPAPLVRYPGIAQVPARLCCRGQEDLCGAERGRGGPHDLCALCAARLGARAGGGPRSPGDSQQAAAAIGRPHHRRGPLWRGRARASPQEPNCGFTTAPDQAHLVSWSRRA